VGVRGLLDLSWLPWWRLLLSREEATHRLLLGKDMRTFLCIPIDEALRVKLADLSSRLQRLVHVRANWVRAENFHLTVRFLGEIDPMLTLDLQRCLRAVLKHIPPFVASINKLGAFPSTERPRVVWAGGRAADPFVELISLLEQELTQLGFPRERKPSMSHVTLARIKGKVDDSVEEAMRSLARIPCWDLQAKQLVLMESRLTSRGAVYSPLFSLPMRG